MGSYNITRGQLITLWIFGFFLWIFSFFQGGEWGASVMWWFLFFLIPAGLIFYTIGWKNYKKKVSQKEYDTSLEKAPGKSQIKCVNCGYLGEGLKGRSRWASILVLLLIPFAPIIPIIYFLATPKWLCPKCKSKFVEEIDQQGKVIKSRNILLVIALIFVSIAIIGILSSIVLVSLGGARTKARDARRIADVRQVATALEIYFTDNGSYPITSDWNELSSMLTPYLSSLPFDPQNEYPCIYSYTSDGINFIITYCSEETNEVKKITNYSLSP